MNVIFSWLICFTNIDINFKCKEGIKHNEHIFVMGIIFECNIPNFGPTIYKHEPIDHDDYIDVLFLYWVKDPTAYEHDDFLCILGVNQLFMIYVYIC